MELNIFLFDPAELKIGHGWFIQAQVASTDIHEISKQLLPIRTKANVLNQYFFISQFQKIYKSGEDPNVPTCLDKKILKNTESNILLSMAPS